MCGIVGFIGSGTCTDLDSMVESLKHRGPDDHGSYFGNGVALGQTRLSIIDLSPLGHQPMWDEAQKVGLVFNGEIYNFQKLRDELLRRGHGFKGGSDTEVILHAYLEYGKKCFEKLEGMFAIGIYDSRSGELILARDRMGKKPLFYYPSKQGLVFGSEMKALFAYSGLPKKINLASLNKYLQYEYVPTPATILEGVYKLEPGSLLVYKKPNYVVETFWKPNMHEQSIEMPEALSRLDELLSESVHDRLVSDVPLGVFLSGGLDSSTIAYYAQKNSKQRINTYSVGFHESGRGYDESAQAELVAKHLGTDHTMRMVTSQDMIDMLPSIGNLLDEPFSDASLIPTFFLSQFVRKHITVALSGDGADELFAGYSTFQADRFARLYAKIPLRLRRSLIEWPIAHLPVKDRYFSWEFKLKKFFDGFTGEHDHRHQLWLGSFNRAEREALFSPKVWERVKKENEFEDTDRYLFESKAEDERNKMLYLYQRTYMMDFVLVKVDRASMAASLEVRSPFLDTRVVEFVNTLPYEMKLKGFTTKFLLKKLVADTLPSEIVDRPKKGFGIPLALWLKEGLNETMHELLSESELKKHGLFNAASIQELMNDHETGRKNNAKKIWTLMVFQLWYDRWFSGK